MDTKITPLVVGPANCYLIQQAGTILVDTGSLDGARKLPALMSKHGVDPRDLRLILITHGHFDHIGGISVLRAVTNCPVAAHRLDCEMIEKGYAEATPYLSRSPLMGVLSKVMEAAMRVPDEKSPYPPAVVDIVLGEAPFSLAAFGVEGTVYHTPGHTPGSLSVVLGNGDTIIGDTAVNGLPLRIGPGMSPVGYDADLMKNGWRLLIEKGARTIYPGHGGAFPVEALARYL